MNYEGNLYGLLSEGTYVETNRTTEEYKRLVTEKRLMLKALTDLTTKCSVMPNSKCGEDENPFSEAVKLVESIKFE